MPLHQYTPGVKIPSGIEPVNPIPIDSWSGPYSAVDGTTGSAITAALANIPDTLRFLSMEVRILARTGVGGATQAYKYWFRGSTATLEEFSSGGGGIVGDYVTSFNGRTGAVQGVSAAVAGDGVSVSGATGTVTITNTGVTRAVAGTGISVSANTGTVTITNTGVQSFNGLTGVLQGVSAAVAGTGIQVSGATGSVTITNIGVQSLSINASGNGIQANTTSGTTGAITYTLTNTGVHSFNGNTGAVTGASLGANTFNALNTFSAGISTNGATLSGTITAPTRPVGTNDTTVATTAFVQTEIIADTVTAFNGRTGSVQGVSAAVAGDGVSVSGATGTVTFTNTGVTRAAAGNGISVSANTGTVTITNTGVLSFNGNAGAVQGVSAAVAGDAITVSGATGSVTITNAGVTRAVAGTGISVSANTGTVTITNIGVQSFNGLTGVLQGVSAAVAGSGIQVSGATGSVTITNIGVQSFNGNTGAVTGASLGANTFTGLNTFNAGISAAGATFNGTVRVGSNTTFSTNGDATIGATLTVNGNFFVSGTVTTVNRTDLSIDDINIRLAGATTTSMSDALADGGGLILNAGANNRTWTWSQTRGWESSQGVNVASGNGYAVNGTSVLNATSLGSSVVSSSLTSVGTIATGVWQGSIIGATYGGTSRNLSGAGASGGLVYRDALGLNVLGVTGSATQVLIGSASGLPAWSNITALTGITATSINVTDASNSAAYFLTFVSTSGSGTRELFSDTGITYNPSTNMLSCTQIEAIVDGGVWT